jgi:hypothetical protein
LTVPGAAWNAEFAASAQSALPHVLRYFLSHHCVAIVMVALSSAQCWGRRHKDGNDHQGR